MQIGNQPNPFAGTKVIGGGKVAVGIVAVAVAFPSQVKSILITADESNTAKLYIGGSNVGSDGSNAITYLNGGDEFGMDFDDSQEKLYIVAAAEGQYFWKGGML